MDAHNIDHEDSSEEFEFEKNRNELELLPEVETQGLQEDFERKIDLLKDLQQHAEKQALKSLESAQRNQIHNVKEALKCALDDLESFLFSGKNDVVPQSSTVGERNIEIILSEIPKLENQHEEADLVAGFELDQLSSMNNQHVCVAINESTVINAESPEGVKDQPYNINNSELTIREKFNEQINALKIILAENDLLESNIEISNLRTGSNLRNQLLQQQEEIYTLQNVLKANKHTAEVAMANLISKYESEKYSANETIMKLQNELKVLKQDKDTLDSLKAEFAERLDELVAQRDEIQRQLDSSKDTNHHLKAVLKLSISKRVSQKAEEGEMDKNKSHIGRNKRRHDDKSR